MLRCGMMGAALFGWSDPGRLLGFVGTIKGQLSSKSTARALIPTSHDISIMTLVEAKEPLCDHLCSAISAFAPEPIKNGQGEQSEKEPAQMRLISNVGTAGHQRITEHPNRKIEHNDRNAKP